MVLSRNGAGFTSLRGNSKQKLSFYKETYGDSTICIDWSKVLACLFIVLTLFILLCWSQNKACVTLDQYCILALKNVAVWRNHAVINLIGNHFETCFCQVFLFF